MSVMRKTAPALACLVLAALAWPAMADEDSQLEISGRVAVGLDRLDNIGASGKNTWRGSGNNWGTSLLDIKGSQGLGEFGRAGQLRALFLLESGFDANKGQLNGDTLFNRRAYAGLESSRWGTLMLGKNLSLSINAWYVDPFYQQFMGSETLVRGRSWQGVDDMVGYKSPTWNGWTAELQLGLDSDSPGPGAGRKQAAMVNYTSKAVEFYTIYDQRLDGEGRYSSVFVDSREWISGAVWHLPGWDLFAGYNRMDAPDALPVEAGGDGYRRASHAWAGAQWWPTQRWRLQAAAYHIDVSDGGGSATLAALGTTFDFSDDFFVYASYGRAMNSANADFSAEATDERPSAGRDQNALYFGFVYSFKGVFGGHGPR